jgi:asparagine N-glycosylation enzyme membrane subunit Stt3
MEHHTGRLPTVVAVRIARVWDFFRPAEMAQVETGEGRPYVASLAGLGFYYALLPFAVGGIVLLRRRHIDQWFLLVPAAVVTLVSAVSYGLVRFRAPFEVCLVVLAAVAMAELAHRVRDGRANVGIAGAASGSVHLDRAGHRGCGVIRSGEA